MVDFSIIIPCYNEEKSIPVVIESLLSFISSNKNNFEIIVVDDGSLDKTKKNIEKFHNDVILISHKYNRGYGASLKTGLKNSVGKKIIFFDGDGQHDVKYLQEIINKSKEYDFIIGNRTNYLFSTIFRQPGKLFIKFLLKILISRKIKDFNSGLKLIERNLILSILNILPDGFSFSTTSTIAIMQKNIPFLYCDINIKKRIGKSSLKISDGFKTIMMVLNLVCLFAPLRLFITLSLVCFIPSVYYIVNSYLLHSEASLKGILLMIASLNFFLFGLLINQVSSIRRGEYLK
ncbi:glycosyltransferase family 2 protein [Alphaproteobacteria bacterium]|nr:glycosyltransferase family 2 protein [Alphaproteobacteria bacterium]